MTVGSAAPNVGMSFIVVSTKQFSHLRSSICTVPQAFRSMPLITTRLFIIVMLVLDTIVVFKTRHDIWGTKYRQGQLFPPGPAPGFSAQQGLDTFPEGLLYNAVSRPQPRPRPRPPLSGMSVDTQAFYTNTNVHEPVPGQTVQHELRSTNARTPRYELGSITQDLTASPSYPTNRFPPTTPTQRR